MFKKMLAAMSFLILGVVNSSAGTDVYSVINDSYTVNMVTVSSSAATALFTASLVGSATTFQNVMEGRRILEIQNVDTSSFTFLSCKVSLSSTSASGDMSLTDTTGVSATVGEKIPPMGSGWDFTRRMNLAARNNEGRVFIPWCINNGGVASSTVAIIQGKSR